MDLSRLDLNLLVALDALLRQRSVSRAAAELGLSQPGVSKSLRRLRGFFDDALLVRVGNAYELTPFAVRLGPRLHEALELMERVLEGSAAQSDPRTSTRQFRVMLDDYTMELIGRQLIQLLEERAPNARLEFDPMPSESVQHPERGLRSHDLVIAPHGILGGQPHDLRHVNLFHDRWQVITSARNAALTGAVTNEALAAQSWVAPLHKVATGAPVLARLRALGLEPRVTVVSHSCLLVPALVAAGAGHVASLPERLVRRLPAHEFKVVPVPFEIGGLVEAMWWRPFHEHDPEHAFLRTLVSAAAGELEAHDERGLGPRRATRRDDDGRLVVA